MSAKSPYPVRVDASLDVPLSRGLWLVKWLLLLPHYLVLALLWLAFAVLSVVAFFAILVTGRYPRSLFDFNVGVLRWTWRVQYYGYGALGTDRYPPFTLAEVPDYPARLDIPYPSHLSRGLVLVKWLLAIPHYLVLALFVGGGVWLGVGWWSDAPGRADGWAFGGLVPLLVFIAGVLLLFSGRYPAPIYDFVLGMDRWALRVAGYVGLMTDEYPPFRLDLGGTDPGSRSPAFVPGTPSFVPGTPSFAPGTPSFAPGTPSDTAVASGAMAGTLPGENPPVAPPSPPTSNWTTGRVVAAVVGSLLLLTSTGLLTAGGAMLWADQNQRDDAGYVWTPEVNLRTGQYAITTDGVVLEGAGLDWVVDDLLGTVRFKATPVTAADSLFIGVARTADVDAYLRGVGYEMLGPLGQRSTVATPSTAMTSVPGGNPAMPPGEASMWVASAEGSGTQVIDWRPSEGQWTVVLMRADGRAGVSADVSAAATVPGLTWVAVVLLSIGLLAAGAGAVLLAGAVSRAHRHDPPGAVPAGPTPTGPPVTPAGASATPALNTTPSPR